MTRNERVELNRTDPRIAADRRESTNPPEPRRPDLEDTVESVATLIGVGLLVGTVLLATFKSHVDSRTSRVERTQPVHKQTIVPNNAAEVAPKVAQVPDSALNETVHTKIVIENGNVGITRYVLRSRLGANVLELHSGESIASRKDLKLTLNESGSFKRIISSGTRGTVLKFGDDEISIEVPAPPQLNKLRMKRAHGHLAVEREKVQAGGVTIITDGGGA